MPNNELAFINKEFKNTDKFLFLGSITAPKGEGLYYYASKTNYFWMLLSHALNDNKGYTLHEEINKENPDLENIRKEFVKFQDKYSFRIMDLLTHVIYKKDKNAQDSNIDWKNSTWNKYLLKGLENSNIEYVFSTSKTVHNKFISYLKKYGNEELKNRLKDKTFVLPSPSHNAFNFKEINEGESLEAFKKRKWEEIIGKYYSNKEK